MKIENCVSIEASPSAGTRDRDGRAIDAGAGAGDRFVLEGRREGGRGAIRDRNIKPGVSLASPRRKGRS